MRQRYFVTCQLMVEADSVEDAAVQFVLDGRKRVHRLRVVVSGGDENMQEIVDVDTSSLVATVLKLS